jgi:IS66 C-terminal element
MSDGKCHAKGAPRAGRSWPRWSTQLKLHYLDPQAYLADVLERIVSGQTKSHQLQELLAWNWKAARERCQRCGEAVDANPYCGDEASGMGWQRHGAGDEVAAAVGGVVGDRAAGKQQAQKRRKRNERKKEPRASTTDPDARVMEDGALGGGFCGQRALRSRPPSIAGPPGYCWRVRTSAAPCSPSRVSL